MKRSTIVEIISALFILLFVYTGTSKLFEGVKFETLLRQSPLIGNYASIISWFLPISELVIVLLVVFPKTKLFGFYCSGILMAIFTLYIAYMMAFAAKLPCSCGGVLKHMTWKQHLVFNIFFIFLAIWAVRLISSGNDQNLTLANTAPLQTET